MDLFDEYKEFYYKEIEHSDRLNGKISTALTLLTILGAGEILLLKDLFPFTPTLVHNIYGILCILSFISFMASIYMFTKAYSGYNYNYFPLKSINDAIKEISETINNSSIEVDGDLIDKYIKRMFKERYIEDAMHNREQNIIKNNRHRILNVLITITFIIVMISFILQIISTNEIVIYHIKILG